MPLRKRCDHTATAEEQAWTPQVAPHPHTSSTSVPTRPRVQHTHTPPAAPHPHVSGTSIPTLRQHGTHIPVAKAHSQQHLTISMVAARLYIYDSRIPTCPQHQHVHVSTAETHPHVHSTNTSLATAYLLVYISSKTDHSTHL